MAAALPCKREDTMTIALNPNQQAILEHAAQHSCGKIAWLPEHIKGGARAKVLEGLFRRALITPYGDEWIVAAEGYDALGLPRPGVLAATNAMDDPELEADVASAEGHDDVACAGALNEMPRHG